MHKSFVIKLIHVSVFLLFVLLYIGFEEQEMVGTMMYHVDLTTNFAPYRNFLLLAVSLFMLSFCLLGRWPRIFFSRFLLLMYLYVVADSLVWGPAESSGALAYVVLLFSTMLPLLVYNFSYNAAIKLPQKAIEISMGIGLVVLAAFYAKTFQMVMLSYVLDSSFRDGTVYVFMMFLPFVMTLSNKKWRNLGILLIFLALTSSLKRGGLVTSVIALVAYYIVSQRVNEKHTAGLVKILAFVAVLIFIVIVLIYINYTSDGMILDRFSSMDSDGGSGRDVVYARTWELITDSNGIELLLGHGWNFVRIDSPLEVSAHNDYLEAMYDLGIIGFLFLFILLLQLFWISHRLVRSRSEYAAAYTASVVIFFITTMISHLFLYPLNMTAMTLFWGYVAGKEQMKRDIISSGLSNASKVDESLQPEAEKAVFLPET